MSQQRARSFAKIWFDPHPVLWAIGSLWLVACASAELEVPPTHPGHPQATPGRLARTEALTKAYALDTRTSEAAVRSGDHAQHQHGAEVVPGGSEKATQGPSQPAGAAAFTCPMHPEVIRTEPGKCPVCGMNLVPKKDAK